MRLFYIQSRGCKHISDRMPAIKAIYQLEAEFEPYLVVDFLPNPDDKHPGGIILQAGKDVIERDYTFNNPNDIVELRKIIWDLVRKHHNPPDITYSKCMKDFHWYPTFKVTQGWAARRRQQKGNTCCKDEGLYWRTPDLASQRVKHDVYKVITKDEQTKEDCLKLRSCECKDNYPSNSDSYKRCIDEVTLLCNSTYPKNPAADKVQQERDTIRKYLLDYLKKNRYRADKKHFDLLVMSGLLEHPDTRLGNKHSPYSPNSPVDHAIKLSDTREDKYRKMIEGFSEHKKSCTLLLVLALIIICIVVQK